MRILLYVVMGLVVGSFSGALGIGGGVLLIPALIWLCGFDYPKAAGTSLAVLVPPVGLLAAWKSYTQGRVDVEAAVWIAVSFAVGAYGGAAAVKVIPQEVLRVAFGLLMLYIATRFIVSSKSETVNAAAGLAAVAVGWPTYLGLRRLGRKHLTPPDLGRAIRDSKQQRGG